MNQQINKVIGNSKNILVIIFAVTFFGLGILTWQDCVVWGDKVKETKEISKDKLIDWKTYRSKEFGFEIKYPGNFLVKKVVDNNRKSEFIIEIAEKKWRKTPVHFPAFYLSIIKTELSSINWLDEVYDPISETKIKYSKDPPHGYSDVKHSQINNMPVLQFKIWGASGSNDSTLIKKGPNFLYKLDAHHSSNGVFPEDIYNQMLSTFRFFGKSTDTYEKPVNAFNASNQCFIWEFAGDKREYNQNAKLEPVDSSVKFTFLRRDSQLFLYLTSTKVYHSVTYNFTASLKATKDNINVNLLGIDSSTAIFRALGQARSEIPLPELNDVFKLNFEYGSKKDSYKIELINDRYKYTPLKGTFTEINNCIDENLTGGIARIQRI